MEEEALTQALQKILKRDVVKSRMRLLRFLMEKKDSRTLDLLTLDLLIEALKDTDHDLRGYAVETLIEALMEIGNAKAVECIKQYLNDESEYVQKAAKEALNILSFKGLGVRDSLDVENLVDEKPYVDKRFAYVESGVVFCSFHRAAMLEGEAVIWYGTIDMDEEIAHKRAERKLFPNLNREFHYGCIDYGKEKTLVLYCPECRKAVDMRGHQSRMNIDDKTLENLWAEMPEDKEGKMRHVARFYVDRKITFDPHHLRFHSMHQQWENREDTVKFLQILKGERVEFDKHVAQLFSKLD